MLSDACFEFLDSLRKSARELHRAAVHYADSPINYGDEIGALIKACDDIQSAPWNEESALRLIKLAGSVLSYHDTLPGAPERSARQARMNDLIGVIRSDLGEAAADEMAVLVPDLTSDSAKGESAAQRLKPLLSKLGKVAYDVAIKIITDIASTTVKKTLGL